MKKSVLTSLTVAVALAGITAVATAVENNSSATNDNGGQQWHHHRRHGMMRALREVGVTDAQKEQIRGIMRESRPAMQPLVKQLVQERRALRNAIQTSPVNEQAIRAQAARVAQLQADLAVKRAYTAERVHAVLTPDQVAKLKEFTAKRDAKADEWLNRRGDHNGT